MLDHLRWFVGWFFSTFASALVLVVFSIGTLFLSKLQKILRYLYLRRNKHDEFLHTLLGHWMKTIHLDKKTTNISFHNLRTSWRWFFREIVSDMWTSTFWCVHPTKKSKGSKPQNFLSWNLTNGYPYIPSQLQSSHMACRVSFWKYIGVSKNRGVSPKLDGENNGKPYEQMDDLGGFNPLFSETPIMIVGLCSNSGNI